MDAEFQFNEIEKAVQDMIGGDDQARQKLIQLSFDRLQHLTRKMLKDFPTVRRWEETDDVFQRATLRLWKSLENVCPENSRHFFNLAALQVRRELIELARSFQGPCGLGKNHESVAGKDSLHDPAMLNAGSESLEASKLAAWSDFHHKVDELDPEEKEVFTLVWYQGFSQNDIATLLNVSQKTISRRWQKASRSIYEKLGRALPE